LPARITNRPDLACPSATSDSPTEDARILAQKQRLNPDLWSDVKKALPLLALPEYYEDAKFGYARGGMPVAFVDRVRAYYDILVRQEPAYEPRLRAFPFAMSQ
jgi:membrane-bound lytic murein transglycosylase F